MSDLVQCENMAAVLRLKAGGPEKMAVVVFCCPADPAQKTYLGAVQQVYKLLGEQIGAAFGFIDVDGDHGQDLATPFKLRAIPTTVFYRGQKETARVENADVDGLRKTMAAHMPQDPSQLEAAVVKKYAETDSKEITGGDGGGMVRADSGVEFRVMSAHFGDINSGKVVDVTDRVRHLLVDDKKASVLAEPKALGVEDFDNKENNVLRVVVSTTDKGSKVFTIKEGKSLSLACKTCFAGTHRGDEKVGFTDGRGGQGHSSLANDDDDSAFDGTGIAANKEFQQLPPRIPCGG